MKEVKIFRNWKAQEIENAFGIKRTRHSEILDGWLTAKPKIIPHEERTIKQLRQSAESNIDHWDDAALRYFLVGPLITLVDFNQERYCGLLEQWVHLRADDFDTGSEIDFIVANRHGLPTLLEFSLYLYKPRGLISLNPKGQLLIALLAERFSNEKVKRTKPVYGSFVNGRMWFFVVLNGDEYTISRAFDITQPDGITSIWNALVQVKIYISSLHEELG